MGNNEKVIKIPKAIFTEDSDNFILNESNARDLFLALDANISEWDGTNGKYLTSKCLNMIGNIKANFLNKLYMRANDEEINTFDMLEEINALYLLHKMENEELSHMMKVRKKRRC